MKKIGKILIEIGVFVVIFVAVAFFAKIVFTKKIPIAKEIPEAEVYVKIDKSDFVVATGGIENAQNETVIYESTPIDMEKYVDEQRYTTGKTEPLVSSAPGTSDIPTDVIRNAQ